MTKAMKPHGFFHETLTWTCRTYPFRQKKPPEIRSLGLSPCSFGHTANSLRRSMLCSYTKGDLLQYPDETRVTLLHLLGPQSKKAFLHPLDLLTCLLLLTWYGPDFAPAQGHLGKVAQYGIDHAIKPNLARTIHTSVGISALLRCCGFLRIEWDGSNPSQGPSMV